MYDQPDYSRVPHPSCGSPVRTCACCGAAPATLYGYCFPCLAVGHVRCTGTPVPAVGARPAVAGGLRGRAA